MHAHRCMPTTTISLEKSAYELLRSKKRQGESFSEELRRLLASQEPKLSTLLDLLPPRDGGAIADAIERVRTEDLASERRRSGAGGSRHGRRA